LRGARFLSHHTIPRVLQHCDALPRSFITHCTYFTRPREHNVLCAHSPADFTRSAAGGSQPVRKIRPSEKTHPQCTCVQGCRRLATHGARRWARGRHRTLSFKTCSGRVCVTQNIILIHTDQTGVVVAPARGRFENSVHGPDVNLFRPRAGSRNSRFYTDNVFGPIT